MNSGVDHDLIESSNLGDEEVNITPGIPKSGRNVKPTTIINRLPISTESETIFRTTPPHDGNFPESRLPIDGVHWENIPSERKKKVTLIAVCLLTAGGIIAYGTIENKEIMYKKSNTTSCHKRETVLYTKEEHVTYPVFLNLGFGLLGIIFGVFVDRCCLFLEELRQFKMRYNRNCSKVFKSCFSGISWAAVFIVACIIIGSCVLGRKTPLKVADAIYVLGGIGVGPLLIHFLNLNTESNITVSRILEKKKMYPGYILAWSYYFNPLVKEVEDFYDKVLKTDKSKELYLDQMILLLIPGTDISNIDDLISHDEMIVKLATSSHESDQFPVYKLTYHEDEYNFVMKCVRDPIVALRKMKESKKVVFVDDDSYTDELKRFYKTLTEILEDAPDDMCTKKGLVVPVTVKVGHYYELNHGGLVKIIMAKVNSLFKLNAASQRKKNKNGRSNNSTYGSTSERERLLPGPLVQIQTLDERPSTSTNN